jgi:hypothetical protein
MKEILKKTLAWKTLEPYAIGVGTVLLLEFLIFPGLTINNTFINLLSAVTLLWLIIFTTIYLKAELWQTKVTQKESKDKKEKENKNESTTI